MLGLADGDDDPTCAEHALVNILEEARKAIDAVVRRLMNITEEQAAKDAEKVKALRTVVGWFSSPACSLIFMMQKYVALHSSKGYAIGAKAAVWLEAEITTALADLDASDAEMLGYVQDMQAIRGSRMYVFFMDAAVTDRLLQPKSVGTYLEQEKDLADSNAGGKLRHAILTGRDSAEARAAVRAMAIVCDAVVWAALKALKPGDDQHVLNVLPDVWPKIHSYFGDAASDPASVVEGSLQLSARLGQPSPTEAPTTATRGGRARLDMLRIRAAATGDPLVEEMLAAAFKAMVPATENHASEWLPGGKLCTARLTPALFKRYDALVSTSTAVERIHAIGKSNDERAGSQREDTRAGTTLAKNNNQSGYLQSKSNAQLVAIMDTARPEARAGWKVTEKRKRLEEGMAKREGREARLKEKRAKREAKAAEERRIAALTVCTKYSELCSLDNTALADQLKHHKQTRKLAGLPVAFTATQKNRTNYVLQLQSLLTEEHGAAANDLDQGDDGTAPVGVVRQKKRAAGEQGGGGRARKQKTSKLTNDCGDEWEEDDEFQVEAILGTRISAGVRAGDTERKGTVLYHIAWKGYSAAASTWEPAANIHPAIISEYEESLRSEAAADAAANEDLEDSDDEADE